ERQLHLLEVVAAGVAPTAWRVEGDVGLLVLERLDVLAHGRHLGLLGVAGHDGRVTARGPADAALDEVLEAGVGPGALVVAPGGVEDAALALRPHPGPRLLLIALLAVLEDGAVPLVVLGVDVGLVPALEALEALHDRVVRLGGGDTESAGVVALELGADQVD